MGVFIGPFALFESLLYLSKERQELETTHGSQAGFYIAVLIGIAISALGLLISFFLLRYAFRGNTKTD
jgi:hypothetical protein